LGRGAGVGWGGLRWGAGPGVGWTADPRPAGERCARVRGGACSMRRGLRGRLRRACLLLLARQLLRRLGGGVEGTVAKARWRPRRAVVQVDSQRLAASAAARAASLPTHPGWLRCPPPRSR
jgi:hypothetical protein